MRLLSTWESFKIIELYFEYVVCKEKLFEFYEIEVDFYIVWISKEDLSSTKLDSTFKKCHAKKIE